jgi:hypothetical protein
MTLDRHIAEIPANQIVSAARTPSTAEGMATGKLSGVSYSFA